MFYFFCCFFLTKTYAKKFKLPTLFIAPCFVCLWPIVEFSEFGFLSKSGRSGKNGKMVCEAFFSPPLCILFVRSLTFCNSFAQRWSSLCFTLFRNASCIAKEVPMLYKQWGGGRKSNNNNKNAFLQDDKKRRKTAQTHCRTPDGMELKWKPPRAPSGVARWRRAPVEPCGLSALSLYTHFIYMQLKSFTNINLA